MAIVVGRGSASVGMCRFDGQLYNRATARLLRCAPRVVGDVASDEPVKYRTIVADPPWHYDAFAQGGQNHRGKRPKGVRRTPEEQGNVKTIPSPYPSMPIEEIEQLPVAQLADEDCRLFLWATMRYLPDAMRISSGWGFTYKQLVVWDKTPFFNPLGGSIAPNAAEFLIVATKGHPARIGRWGTSVIRARKARTVHSVKPDVFLDLAESTSPGPYLELFARRNRLGWDTWGNEALCHAELAS